MSRKIHTILIAFIFSLTITASCLWYIFTPTITIAEKTETIEIENEVPIQQINKPEQYEGDHVIAHLNTMTLELKHGTTSVAILPILSQGKPNSYYETIGGVYYNDYTTKLHFSSIGQVYMPYSVHVFGNYFIHGIPYYPNGTEVSSSYSGGCIRLQTTDAKMVYDFVKKGTPIIITRGSEYDFTKTNPSETILESMEMTRLMSVIISLEFLTQDNEIFDRTTKRKTTRKDLIPQLLTKQDDAVSALFASALGKERFIEAMNQKAQALGMAQTTFIDTKSPSITTEADTSRFLSYVNTYKSYLATSTITSVE